MTELAPLSRREKKKLQTRQAIVAAARGLFAAQGIDNTTMEEIAERADVSRATLFNYFPTRLTVIDALVSEQDDAFYAVVADWMARSEDPVERLRGLFDDVAAYLRSKPEARSLVGYSERGWTTASGTARMTRINAEFARLLGYGEVVEGSEQALIVEAAVSIYVGIIHNWRLHDDYDLTLHLRGATELVRRLMGRRA